MDHVTSSHADEMSWLDPRVAVCAQPSEDPEGWFLKDPHVTGRLHADRQKINAARAKCETCPLVEACAAYGKAHHRTDGFILDGIWGGWTPHERDLGYQLQYETSPRAGRTVPTTPLDVSKCGTTAGYAQHGRRGQEACAPCKAARSEYARNLEASKPVGQRRSKCGRPVGIRRHWQLGEELCVACEIAERRRAA